MRALDLLLFGEIRDVNEKRVHRENLARRAFQLKVSLAFWIRALHVVELNISSDHGSGSINPVIYGVLTQKLR
jgi:hypothetical protein